PCGNRLRAPPAWPARQRPLAGTRWPWAMPIPGATRLWLGGATSGRPGLEGSGRACARLRAASQESPQSISGCASAADAPASARVLCRPSRTPPDSYTKKTRPAAGPGTGHARDLTPLPPRGISSSPPLGHLPRRPAVVVGPAQRDQLVVGVGPVGFV